MQGLPFVHIYLFLDQNMISSSLILVIYIFGPTGIMSFTIWSMELIICKPWRGVGPLGVRVSTSWGKLHSDVPVAVFITFQCWLRVFLYAERSAVWIYFGAPWPDARGFFLQSQHQSKSDPGNVTHQYEIARSWGEIGVLYDESQIHLYWAVWSCLHWKSFSKKTWK